MEQIDWTTKDVVVPSKLKVGDIISYILFNEGDNGYEHTRQLLVEYREREVYYNGIKYRPKHEFLCIILKTASDVQRPGETSTFEILKRYDKSIRDISAEYWRIFEAAK